MEYDAKSVYTRGYVIDVLSRLANVVYDCRRCGYAGREKEGVGRLGCRWHPLSAIGRKLACCGEPVFPNPSLGCTACDHTPNYLGAHQSRPYVCQAWPLTMRDDLDPPQKSVLVEVLAADQLEGTLSVPTRGGTRELPLLLVYEEMLSRVEAAEAALGLPPFSAAAKDEADEGSFFDQWAAGPPLDPLAHNDNAPRDTPFIPFIVIRRRA